VFWSGSRCSEAPDRQQSAKTCCPGGSFQRQVNAANRTLGFRPKSGRTTPSRHPRRAQQGPEERLWRTLQQPIGTGDPAENPDILIGSA
jgi:hypothetical protein